MVHTKARHLPQKTKSDLPMINPTFDAGIMTSIKDSPGAIVGTDI